MITESIILNSYQLLNQLQSQKSDFYRVDRDADQRLGAAERPELAIVTA